MAKLEDQLGLGTVEEFETPQPTAPIPTDTLSRTGGQLDPTKALFAPEGEGFFEKTVAPWMEENIPDWMKPQEGVFAKEPSLPDLGEQFIYGVGQAAEEIYNLFAEEDTEAITQGLQIPQTKTTMEDIVRGGSQFLVPFTGMFKAGNVGAKLVTNWQNVPKWFMAANAAVSDFVVASGAFDPADPNLSNMIEEDTKLVGPILQYLQTDPNDPDAINRLKHGVESLLVGGAATVTFAAFLKMVQSGFRYTAKTVFDRPTSPLSPEEMEAFLKGDEKIAWSGTNFWKTRNSVKQELHERKLNFIQQSADEMLGAKVLDADYLKATGNSIDTYTTMRLTARIPQLVDTWVNHGTITTKKYEVIKQGDDYFVVDELGEVVHTNKNKLGAEEAAIELRDRADFISTGRPGLAQILSPVIYSGHEKNFFRYALALRMRHLVNTRPAGFRVEFDADTMGAYIKNGENATFDFEGKSYTYKEVADRLENWNTDLVHFAHDNGLVNAETMQRLLDEGLYIPMYRKFSKGRVVIAGRTQRRAGGRGGLTKAIKGAAGYVLDDPVSSLVRNAANIIEASVKNNAKRHVYDMLDRLTVANPDLARLYAKREPNLSQVVDVSKAQIIAALRKQGIDLPEDALTDDAIPFFIQHLVPGGNNIDLVYRAGVAHAYKIENPFLATTVAAMGPRPGAFLPEAMIRIGAGFKHLLTDMTTLSGEFLIRNSLFRDLATAFLLRKSVAFNPFMNIARRVKAGYTYDKDYIEYMANGGGLGAYHEAEATVQAAKLRAFYKGRGFNPDQILNPFQLWRLWKTAASIGETSNRYGEYLNLIGEGATRRTASLAAREITTDFSLRGSNQILRTFTSLVPFLNAGIQGVYRTARAVTTKGERKQVLARMAATMVPPTLFLWYLNHDNPKYLSQPDYIRDTHWIIDPETIPGLVEALDPEMVAWLKSNSADRLFLIPKPFEFGGLTSMVERGADAMYDFAGQMEGKEPTGAAAAFPNAFGGIVADMFRFNITPQAFAGLYNLFSANEDHLGRPIISGELEGVDPEFQFNAYTSDTAKFITKFARLNKVGLSPIEFEYLFKAYLGSIGVHALDLADYVTRPEGFGPTPTKRWDETMLTKVFIKDEPFKATQEQYDFYAILNNTSTPEKTIDILSREPYALLQPKDALKEYLKRPDVIRVGKGLVPLLQDTSAQAKVFSSLIQITIADPNMSADSKRKHIDYYMGLRNDLFKTTMNIIKTTPDYKFALKYKYGKYNPSRYLTQWEFE